jgi:hypothetical protein
MAKSPEHSPPILSGGRLERMGTEVVARASREISAAD